MYFQDGSPNGEETAANGAPPHFRIERNFFWVHFLLHFLFSVLSLDERSVITEVFKQSPPRCRRNENLRRLS